MSDYELVGVINLRASSPEGLHARRSGGMIARERATVRVD